VTEAKTYMCVCVCVCAAFRIETPALIQISLFFFFFFFLNSLCCLNSLSSHLYVQRDKEMPYTYFCFIHSHKLENSFLLNKNTDNLLLKKLICNIHYLFRGIFKPLHNTHFISHLKANLTS
jgi:hypothetical protein